MYPNTTDTKKFITHLPDFMQEVGYRIQFDTGIVASKNGFEQRQAKRDKGRYSIKYVGAELTRAEWSVRRTELRQELAAPLVVPLWVRPKELVSIASNTINLDVASLQFTPFKVGSYAFFQEDGKASVFRLITAVNTTSIEVASGNAAFPDIVPPSYTAAAWVYPCIVGMYYENGIDYQLNQVDATSIEFNIMEL